MSSLIRDIAENNLQYIELVIKIPKELYEAYKGRPPMLGDVGMDMIAQSIANGIPLEKLIGTEILKAKQNITVGKEDYNMGIYVGLIKALNIFEDKEGEE